MRRVLLLAVATTALIASGCGSDDDGRAQPTPTRTALATATVAATATAPFTATAVSTPTVVPPTAGNTQTPTASPAPTDAATPTATTVLPSPRAVARRISDPADLIHGPLADSQIGDYLLANDVARFVIQDVGKRDLYSVGAFGGNIIDAELVERPNMDNFLEVQPAVQIETVINAQTIEIVNDGLDGQPAIIRTCGPDDVLDFVNPSTVIEDIGGFPFPAEADEANFNVEGCTEYRLAPDKPYVEMVTTIFNNDDFEIGLFVGDFINAAGQVEQWTSTDVGLGELLTSDLGLMSYIGYGEATGVDYSLVPLPGIANSSFFTASGVSYVMYYNSVINIVIGGPPTFFVPANGSNSFTRYFGVGTGSGGSAVDVRNEVQDLPVGRLQGCVTVGGEPAPNARVTVGPLRAGTISSVRSIYVTDADGCYSGTLVPGQVGVAAARTGTPYEGGGATPVVHAVDITAGNTVVQDIALPATGRLRVSVTDAAGAAVPARVGIVGFDPSPDVRLPPSIVTPLFSSETGLFYDQKEALPFGFVRIEYTDAAGVLELDVEPGDYQVAVSRGVEYSLAAQPVTIESNTTAEVAARIARVVDTTGFVSSDFHVHGIASADARVPDRERVRQYAGEGVDNIIMTDHHSHTDLTPVIDALAFTPFVRATIGEEITTWDWGHFNAYPLTIDPTRPSGGSTDWAVAAPPGEDFVSLGAYSLTPAELLALARTSDTATPDTTIQINHIDSFFDPLQIDTKLVPPQSFISPGDKLRFRIDPESGNLFAHYPALEVWNGSSRGKQAEFIDLRLGIWFNHLSQGLKTTAIGDTDTHEFLPLGAAGARTWTASPTDDPPAIDPADVAREVVAGRAVGGQGVYLQTRLLAGDGSGGVADLTRGGSTTVQSGNGNVTLEIRAQAPIWAPFDRIEIYANANTVVTRSRNGTPTLYTAEPTLVLVAGQDFTVTRETVAAQVPGAERLVATVSVPFQGLTDDTWFAVIAKGTDGVSQPMFPAFSDDLSRTSNRTLADLVDGNLGEGGVLAMGFTNALYADVDGVEGFQGRR